MEHSASTQPPPSAAATTDSRDRTIAGVAAVMLIVGMAVAYFSDNPDTGEIVGFFVLTGLWLIAIALLVTRLVPRWRASGLQRATRIGLILGVLALIACLVFWTGLPFRWASARSCWASGPATRARSRCAARRPVRSCWAASRSSRRSWCC
jgi:peptidoglycan/LPS O-acetylase OafA/YrhL